MATNLNSALIVICVLALSQNMLEVSAHFEKREVPDNSSTLSNIPKCDVMVQKVYSQLQQYHSDRYGDLSIPILRFPDYIDMRHVDCGTTKYCWFSQYDLYSCRNVDNPHYGRWKQVLILDMNREIFLTKLSKFIDGCECRYIGTPDDI